MALWKKYDGKGFFAEIAEKDQNGNNIVESITDLNTKIANCGGIEVVPLNPSTHEPSVQNPNSKILYLTKTDDVYTQWIYKNNAWEKLIIDGDDIDYDDITVEDIEETVETVNELKEDLDTKISTNYPPALVSISDGNIGAYVGFGPGNGGALYGSLFNVPIKHTIYKYEPNNDSEDQLVTVLGVYIKQVNDQNNKVIFGIYEYQPNYKRTDPETGEVTQIGRTVALCDTGAVTVVEGYNEFPIINVNNDNTTDSIDLKTDCEYYASVYFSYGAGNNQPFYMASAPGYNTQMNYVKPQFALSNINQIKASLYPGQSTYTEDLSFNDFGFGWNWNRYPERDGDFDTSMTEAYNVPRFYMQIRNARGWTPPAPPAPPEPISTYYVLQVEWDDNNGANFTFDNYYINGDSIKGDSSILIGGYAGKPNYTEEIENFAGGNFSKWTTGIRFMIALDNKPSNVGWRTLGWGDSKAFTATVYEVTDEGQTWTSIGTITGTQQTNMTYTVNCS